MHFVVVDWLAGWHFLVWLVFIQRSSIVIVAWPVSMVGGHFNIDDHFHSILPSY